ncbi:MAG: DUF4190 domain-containing protein [Pseudolysinimonas sp.]
MTDPAAPAPAPTPAAAAAPAAAPAKGLTIAGIVFAFLIPLLGLILSIVALVQNRRAGAGIGGNIAGIIISIVVPIIGAILLTTVFASLLNACAGLEPGVYDTGNGGTLTCG